MSKLQHTAKERLEAMEKTRQVNMGIIMITKDEYFDLRLAKNSLNRLEKGGVDSCWDYYWEALNPDNEPYDEMKRTLGLEIYGNTKESK